MGSPHGSCELPWPLGTLAIGTKTLDCLRDFVLRPFLLCLQADKILEECMVAAGLQHAIASRFASGKKGVPSPAGQGPAAAAAAAAGSHHAVPPANSVAASKDRISMILNRSKELLLLKRQTELQVLATLSAANGRGASASLVNLQNEQKKLLLGVTGEGGGRPLLTPPSDTNNEVEVLGVTRGTQMPGASTPTPPASNCMVGAPAAPALPEGAVRGAPGKRHSLDGSSTGSRGPTAAVTPAAVKRQRKTASPKTADAMTAAVPAAEMGLPGPGGSMGGMPAVAAAVKQKSIIDFFTSRNKAAASGPGGMKQPLLLAGSGGQGVPRPGAMPCTGLSPWATKQASDTESD